MAIKPIRKEKYDDMSADLFHAAEVDDVNELEIALSLGQNLDERNSRLLHMTPIHIACIKSSNAFLKAACDAASFDPWLRDDNLRVAFDHAAARNNKEAMRMLLPLMHPESPRV